MPDVFETQDRTELQRRNGRGHNAVGIGSTVRQGRTRGGGPMVALRPVRDLPNSPLEINATASPSSANESTRSSRGFVRGRAGQRAGHEHGNRTPATNTMQRTFRGHLSTRRSDGMTVLSAQAPEFVPGRCADALESTSPVTSERAHPKALKSTANDLGTRIHQDIHTGNYECTICTDEILRTSSVWSCAVCWAIFHLACAKKWHHNQKKREPSSFQEYPDDISWRCPGCNSELVDGPSCYHCWCGKDVNPSPAGFGLPPHSCGQTCSRPRATCPHPCPLQCHAGPCPPCNLLGPPQSCFCGKNSSQKLCTETDYENGWSCQEVCGDMLPCGEHFCQLTCHAGLCGGCETEVEAKCYCGRSEKLIPCFERADIRTSYDVTKGLWYEGSFDCKTPCLRTLDCGEHLCSKTCHAQAKVPGHCPNAPDVVSHCPCGKTSIQRLLPQPRQSCKDKIPHCQKPCGKSLPCGHLCKRECHIGNCGFCDESMEVPCRCGKTLTPSLCHQGDVHHPWCTRTCQALMSCGRHKCGERCCPSEKKATERQAARKKSRQAGDITSIEAEHICIRTCGKPLKCGSHACQQLCHRGPCQSCPEAIFQEISCSCGRTVLQPPQPCGTRPPECRFPCQKSPDCGHPPVEHNCHASDILCPKCPFLVERWCACGKERLHSQPCHLSEAYCGKPCGKRLSCGLHSCRKLCHREGECESTDSRNQQCEQLCGKAKRFCEHACQNTCHSQTPCNESTPCSAKATVSCPCGRRGEEIKCLTSTSNPAPARPEMKCDDECLRLERNRRLAAALNIDPASHSNDHVPYANATLQFYRDHRAWSENQEREFRVFAASPLEQRLRYKPMPSAQRQFLHLIAEDYGLESRSEDTEPHRHVVVFKGPRFVSAPTKTLAQCIKIRETQAAEAAVAASTSRPASPPFLTAVEPFNSILLTSPRFALTIEEVQRSLVAEITSRTSLHFHVSFLPSEEVLLRASAHYSASLSPPAIQQALLKIKPCVLKTIEHEGLAANAILCYVDASELVARREALSKDNAGWSAVAGRAASTRPNASTLDDASQSRTKGRKLLGLKKKVADGEKAKPWAALGGDVEC